MDFRLKPEEETFRQEVQTWLAENLPAGWDGADLEGGDGEQWASNRDFAKRLAAKGWIAPAWPVEYGGAGMSVMQQFVFNQEMAYQRAPQINGNAVSMLGPTLIVHGTDEQRRRHLPGITSAEVIWCQGYSEPEAGSDLASLQCRAVRDGDDYVINGQKIWTSNAHRSDWIFMLARTDPDAPKHRGISFFMLDMKTPGITVQPIINMLGKHSFNQVFFEDVRVPAENRVGEENRGWYIGATLLDFERSSIGSGIRAYRTWEDLYAFCKESRTNGHTLVDEPAVRNKLANMRIEIEAGRLISYRVVSMQARGMIPNYEASVAKLYHTELDVRLATTGMEILGLHGQLKSGDPRVRLRGRFEEAYQFSRAMTVGGGASEIQRNIIATRGLGLPRG
ncbi:MAG: acyl-CoA dehydrogenase [Dehalococcoidia bacterium]